MNYVTVDIPVIETERLILRGFEERDFEGFAAMRADPEVMHFIGGAQQPHEAWRTMAATLGHWCLRGFGFFCVEEKSSGALVGNCGTILPHDWPENEIGYSFTQAAQGKGYGTEAATAALSFAYKYLGWKTAISVIDKDNRPSQRVAEKLNARLEQREVAIWNFTADIWRHLPPEDFLKINPPILLH